MLKKKIILYLSDGKVRTLYELKEYGGVSQRTMSSLIKEIRQNEEQYGVRIKTEYGKGYRMEIVDQKAYQDYTRAIHDAYVGYRQGRINLMLYMLLQKKGYVSIQKLCERVEVSRNTLLKDLEELKRILVNNDLKLESKAHYGVRIVGDEDKFRKAFSKYVVNSSYYTLITQEYFRFVESLDTRKVSGLIRKALKQDNLQITQIAFDSLLDHVLVLLYRLSLDNHIQSMEVGSRYQNSDTYFKCSLAICQAIEQEYAIVVPKIEVEYLASQIAGKTSVETIPIADKKELEQEIKRILCIIDEENLTVFSKDTMLINTLLLHMYPLLTRIAYKIELNNPLIELVSSRYANVFLIALRFVELWQEKETIDLSRDEVGYLALHFAGHLERVRQDVINRYRRILVISEVGRGNALLMKQRLEQSFHHAIVSISSFLTAEEIAESKADLVVSTILLDEKDLDIPVFYSREVLSDEDVAQIKDFMVLKQTTHTSFQGHNWIDEMFYEQLFWRTEQTDYLQIVETMSRKMVTAGFADPTFPQLVIEREQKYSTVYENGVAGPHSMLLNAKVESIGVIVPQKKLKYQEKDVEIIFLINLKKGNLFMYREISRMLHALTQDSYLVTRIKKATHFCEFIEILNSIKY